MKSLSSILGVISILLFTINSFSQCASGTPVQILSYDTIVMGNGNSSHTFTMSKFDPALGTLLSADIKSVVKLQYSYTLENQNAVQDTFKSKVLRTDDIYSDALDPSSINVLNSTPFITSILPAHQIKSFGPTRMNYTIANSITDTRLINFMGAGTVDFDYETGSSASVQGPLPWQLNFTSVKDTTDFSVTYRYCPAILLSNDLLVFTALPQSTDQVLLNWRQANVEPNRMYEMQVSTDGVTFTTFSLAIENETGNYYYTYTNTSAAAKLFFRIKENNVSGAAKFSAVRTVVFGIGNQPAVHVAPSLYTGGPLQVTFPVKSNWQVNMYAADGRKVFENTQHNVNAASLQVTNMLGNGVYIVETFNKQSRERQVTRIIVQR